MNFNNGADIASSQQRSGEFNKTDVRDLWGSLRFTCEHLIHVELVAKPTVKFLGDYIMHILLTFDTKSQFEMIHAN